MAGSGKKAAGDDKAVKLTPMMRQYVDMKNDMPEDALLLFRLGDFYEMFFEDAERGATAMEITVTKRNGIPMAGIPYHALDNYLPRLLTAGLKVAIAEQVEDPASAKGIVRREISRIITPGSVTEECILDSHESNFIASLFRQGQNKLGLAVLDMSTGDFRVGEYEEEKALQVELNRLHPAEILLPESWVEQTEWLDQLLPERSLRTSHPDWSFDTQSCLERLHQQLKVTTLDGFGCRFLGPSLTAAGALLDYLHYNLRQSLTHVTSISVISDEDFMIIDRVSQRNLELVQPIFKDSKNATLISVLDRSVTPMGSRLMRDWLLRPLRDTAAIESRLQSVEAFAGDPMLLEELREILRSVRDIERIMTRLNQGSASARELQTLRYALQAIPGLNDVLSYLDTDLLSHLKSEIMTFPELVQKLEAAIVEEPPVSIREGSMFLDGYNEDLDRLRKGAREGKAWIARYESEEKQRSGIDRLKIGYNRVFGYYIELSKVNALNAPEHYIRKQTLANAERYITPELKEIEDAVLGSEDKSKALEYELFCELRQEVIAKTAQIQQTARALAAIDVLSCFAFVSLKNNYTRPQVCDEPLLEIHDGRHPVVDAVLGSDKFVPNDTCLGEGMGTLNLITGPNMAGKSTYIRQVALLTVMAQAGSFIPCSSARIGVLHSVHTRVGAADDLSRGQSTFMVEMVETANILNNAGSRSLVILDEIGRGTSTYDGLSLAWAIAEELHERGALTLFATHYHELTKLGGMLPGVRNWNVAVREHRDNIVFLHKIQEGSADRSYGIHVARLAGLPDSVLKRAKKVLTDLESSGEGQQMSQKKIIGKHKEDGGPSLFDWHNSTK